MKLSRVYDIAGVTDNKVSVYYNDKKINIKSFQDYIELYPSLSKKFYEKSKSLEIGVFCSSNDKFEQSFMKLSLHLMEVFMLTRYPR